MKNSYAAGLALALSTLVAGYAQAADTTLPGKPREQVRAELADAQRAGDLSETHTGKSVNEQYPARFPNQERASGLSREQVLAELLEARRTGELPAGDEVGKKLNERYPGQYPAPATTSGLTRDQVLAELLRAQRSGDLEQPGRNG